MLVTSFSDFLLLTKVFSLKENFQIVQNGFYLREIEVVAPIRKNSFNIRIIERSITVLNYLIVFNNLYYMAYLFMGHALFHMFVSHVFSTYTMVLKKNVEYYLE